MSLYEIFCSVDDYRYRVSPRSSGIPAVAGILRLTQRDVKPPADFLGNGFTRAFQHKGGNTIWKYRKNLPLTRKSLADRFDLLMCSPPT